MFIQRTVTMKYLALIFSLIAAVNIQLAQADSQNANLPITLDQSAMESERLVEQHLKKVSELLDPLMLEDDPRQEFIKMAPRLKEFSTVTKAEFKGKQFYVEFKNGSNSSWELPK